MTRQPDQIDWTPELLAKANVLWNEKGAHGVPAYSVKRMSVLLGVPKNALGGKISRMQAIDPIAWPVRGTPITRDARDVEILASRPKRDSDRAGLSRFVPDNVKAPPQEVPTRSRWQCSWLAGERKPFATCDEWAQIGSSYCPEHHAIVWVATKPKTEQGARLSDGQALVFGR